MMNPKDIRIENYTYALPQNRIAKYPLSQRDKSKLLIYNNNSIIDSEFCDIAKEIPEQSIIVSNNSKVIPARLFFHKESGAVIEIFCLEPHEPTDYQQSFSQTKECTWKCIVGNLKKWKNNDLYRIITHNDIEYKIKATKLVTDRKESIIRFEWNGDISFSQLLELIGSLPIPPYLERETESSDYEKYQTVYSKIDGSVAAPTAGLHFTEKVLSELKIKNHSLLEITLHVGAGTFKPVKSETIGEHAMHGEHFSISKSTIELLLENKNIIAVGTTSARTLESLYWIGVLLLKTIKPVNHIFEISQWSVYEISTDITKSESLKAILNHLNDNHLETLHCKTSIIIVPSYKFRMINQLITNFHQPNSTLLLLIAALVGDSWKDIYDHALKNNYRFLSYGDSSLLFGK